MRARYFVLEKKIAGEPVIPQRLCLAINKTKIQISINSSKKWRVLSLRWRVAELLIKINLVGQLNSVLGYRYWVVMLGFHKKIWFAREKDRIYKKEKILSSKLINTPNYMGEGAIFMANLALEIMYLLNNLLISCQWKGLN